MLTVSYGLWTCLRGANMRRPWGLLSPCTLEKVRGAENTKSINYPPRFRPTAKDSKYVSLFVTRRMPIAERETRSRSYSKDY